MLIEAAIEQRLQIFISDEIISELKDVLRRPKFRKHESLNSVLIAQIIELANFVKPQRYADIVLRDTGDHIIIDCALAAEAEYIVTGDADFLSYGKIKNVHVVKAQEMVDILNK